MQTILRIKSRFTSVYIGNTKRKLKVHTRSVVGHPSLKPLLPKINRQQISGKKRYPLFIVDDFRIPRVVYEKNSVARLH